MSTSEYVPVPVGRYVLTVFAAMVAIILLTLTAIYAFDFTPPNSTGLVTTLVSTIIGVSLFARRIDRPMMNQERLRFAGGVTIINAVVPALFIMISLLIAGLPLSLEGVDLAFGGGQGILQEPSLAGLMLFVLALTFVQAYFFAWLLTRKLPRTVA